MPKKEIESMPTDIRDMIMKSTGMSEEQAEQMGTLSQKIRNFAIDNVVDGDMISPADIALAGLAAKMSGNWLEQAAVAEAREADAEEVPAEGDAAAHG